MIMVEIILISTSLEQQKTPCYERHNNYKGHFLEMSTSLTFFKATIHRNVL